MLKSSGSGEHLTAQALDEFDEPGAVTAGLNADGDFAGEGGMEAADIVPHMVPGGGIMGGGYEG